MAWKRAYRWTDALDKTLVVMLATAASTPLPGECPLFLRVLGKPGSGKSTLCEALSISRKYTFSLSMQTGFHSGYKTEGGKTASLVPDMDGKTTIIKEGDTLVNVANRDRILSEIRDLFDGTSRARYRNADEAQEFVGLRITMILAGTKTLRKLNKSSAGDRFLDITIYEDEGDDHEEDILFRAAKNARRQMRSSATPETLDVARDPKLLNAMELTAGYLHYLRDHIEELTDAVAITDSDLKTCINLGKLIAHMRARPDKEAEEDEEEVELATRLSYQLVRLASCVAVVLGKDEVDEEVMAHIRKVTADTSRGLTMDICQELKHIVVGMDPRTIAAKLGQPPNRIMEFVRFLSGSGIRVLVKGKRPNASGARGRDIHIWKLSDKIRSLLRVLED